MFDYVQIEKNLMEALARAPRQNGRPFTYDDTMRKYRCIREGDLQGLHDVVKEFRDVCGSDWVRCMSSNPLTSCKYLFCIWSTVASRVAIESGVNLDVSIAVLLLFIRMVDEALTTSKIGELFEAIFLEYITLVRNQPIGKISTPLRQALQYITLHVYEKISVHDVSTFCNYTARHLNRIFQKELCMTVSQYIFNQKMLRASQYLLLTEFSLGEISAMLSFSSQSHFTHQFREYYMDTPLRYREKGISSTSIKYLSDIHL